ncbi:MAG TPA: hypothetical protein VLX60_01600 [Terriglobales bacterium]|nr:hypothetical protein [Terriglobales bacterium]
MSQKTSTAALANREWQSYRRRAPRHPAGGKRSNEVKKQRSKETARVFGQAWIAVREEDAMNGNTTKGNVRTIRQILPVILRISFFLVLWTLGAAAMSVVEAQTREQHATQQLPVNRGRVENLQRWVNSGHDAWCRDAKSVATVTIERVAPEFANNDFELASLTTQDGRSSANKAVYTFHSLDGYTAYRVTLRRFGWQTKTAGSANDRIWVPVRVETISRDSLD